MLIKKDGVVLEPLIHGGTSTTIYRSGTPALGLAASMLKALELASSHLTERYHAVEKMNEEVKQHLLSYKKVRINSTKYCIPHILNISVQGVKAGIFRDALEQEGICVSIKSACSATATPSRPVYAVTRDKKNAMCSWRISMSHLTTKEEINAFIKAFDKCYQMLAV